MKPLSAVDMEFWQTDCKIDSRYERPDFKGLHPQAAIASRGRTDTALTMRSLMIIGLTPCFESFYLI